MKEAAGLSGGTFARDSFIAIAVSLILVFIPSCKKKEAPINKEVPHPAVENRAPSFMLKDVRGNNVSLSDFNGKVVVIDFWTTWCSWCKETTQELEKLHNNYKDRDVVFLGMGCILLLQISAYYLFIYFDWLQPGFYLDEILGCEISPGG